jgi:signal transduction histidine kinase/CheY-like chemotaxis protein
MAFFAGLPDAASGPNEYRVRAKDGSYRWVQTSSRPVAVDGRVVGVTGVLADVSDRRRAEAERLELERRLLHAQKLESLGVLAGGIAHDFNNLLMAILGNLDLASMTVPAGSPAHANLEQAIQASRHAADLTRQLLAYSGKGQFEVTTVDLDELVRENASLLHPSIAGPATLVVRSSPEPALVTADPGQIQQVIMNLITNAAEALADGRGEVTLATGVMDCDEAFLRTSRLDEKPAPGRFAALEVRDNGCGMDEATQAHLFDPFFTTKFTGRGLGMAAVLGIVRGHRGAIMVDSAVDAGTAIRVLLPLSADPPAASRPADATLTAGESVLAGRGMVLVVDDDAAVRRLAEYYVRLFGFEAVGAAGGAEALEVLDRRGDDLDLVILDLVMPGMDGVTVFTEIARLRPGLKVLLASGYGEEEAMGRFPDVAPFGFIQKPYRLADLKRKLSVRPG